MQKSSSKLTTVMRPDLTRLPGLPVPFHLRSTGYSAIEPKTFCKGGDNAPFVQVFWAVSGKGEIVFDGIATPLSEGDAVFMRPGESHRYKTAETPMKIRWFTFDGPGAEKFLDSYAYPRLLKGAGQCPHELFDEMATGLREMTPFRQRKLIAVAAEILALAGGGSAEDSSTQGHIVSRFLELAQNNYSNSSVNVNSLAELLEVHRTTLARLFKERMMLSPGEYLFSLRMQHALSLLKDSSMSIAEVSHAVGIDDPKYFCRCVRKVTEMAPRTFRQNRIEG